MRKNLAIFAVFLVILVRSEEDYHTTPEEIDQEVGNWASFTAKSPKFS